MTRRMRKGGRERPDAGPCGLLAVPTEPRGELISRAGYVFHALAQRYSHEKSGGRLPDGACRCLHTHRGEPSVAVG